MLPEFGLWTIILAFCLAAMQAGVFVVQRLLQNNTISLIRPLALGQCFFVFCGYIILTLGFVVDDFSIQYVAQHSNSTLPYYYKITAVWGAHEGSLLLWILLLCIWQIALLLGSRQWDRQFSDAVLAIMGMLTLGFLFLLLFTSNPFARILPEPPLDGADLNPLLQDLGMIMHPPILYAGYVGCSVAFAFAIAGLLLGKIDAAWAMLLRPWVLVAWLFLTLGIALGSWWAYYELGWGGWWFWDPVENASLMPWLTAIALIHCLAIASRNSQLLIMGLFLAIITFALSLLGTFLVRSGSITSVHAFTSDPQRGIFILQFLAISIGGALFLYAVRVPKINFSREKISLNSPTAVILANNIVFLLATACVLIGTLYPLAYDAIFAQQISVGYPYFNAVFVPLMLILFSILLIATVAQRRLLFIIVVLSFSIAVLFLSLWFGSVKVNACIGITFALAIILSTLKSYKSTTKNKPAMIMAHLGLAVTIIGISLTPAYQIERDVQVKVGEQIDLANYNLQFQALRSIDGPNYLGYQGQFVVNKNKRFVARIYPEKRLYLTPEIPMTETAILPGLLQDIYIALGQQINQDAWSVRIYYKPFVRWIWLGAIIMACSGLLAVIVRKSYVK